MRATLLCVTLFNSVVLSCVLTSGLAFFHAGRYKCTSLERFTPLCVAKEDLFASPSEHQVAKSRKKKNKYAKFSKVEVSQQDPLDVLIDQSKQKNQELETANLKRPVIKPPPEASQRLQFPNNKDIDPYDPTTFGYVKIGTVVNPHGVHGWAKVQGCTDFPERLTRTGVLLHMKPRNKRAPRKVILAAGKLIGKDSFLIQLQDCYDREAANSIKGATLYYASQQDKIKNDDDMLVSDLVGFDVMLEDNCTIGVVDGIVLAEEMCSIPGLGHDLLEVTAIRPAHVPIWKPKERILIPFVPEIVPKVDLIAKRVMLDPPAGLLDLTYTREDKVRIKGLLPPARGPGPEVDTA